jgi:hypothetical protein
MERFETSYNFDGIPIPDELPKFVEALTFEKEGEDSTSSEVSSVFSIKSEESNTDLESEFKLTTEVHRVRSSASMPKLLRILK